MGYLDKEYSYSELDTLYSNAKEYCELRNSQYSVLGTMAQNFAMKKAQKMATKGAAGVVASATGSRQEDVHNLMVGAGRMSGIGKTVRRQRLKRAYGNSLAGKITNPVTNKVGQAFNWTIGRKSTKAPNPIGGEKNMKNTFLQDVSKVSVHKGREVKNSIKDAWKGDDSKNKGGGVTNPVQNVPQEKKTGVAGVFQRARNFYSGQGSAPVTPNTNTSQGGINSASNSGGGSSSSTNQGGINSASNNGGGSSSSNTNQGGINSASNSGGKAPNFTTEQRRQLAKQIPASSGLTNQQLWDQIQKEGLYNKSATQQISKADGESGNYVINI